MRFNENIDVRNQWILKTIAEEITVNLNIDRSGIDNRTGSDTMFMFSRCL